MQSRLFAALSGLAFVILAGCASQQETMIRQGYPQSYAEGFEDGCHSGKKAGGSLFDQFNKDVRRFNIDQQYAQGWSDAFRSCESEQEALQRQMRIGIEQQKLIDRRDRNKAREQYQLEREVLRGVDTSKLRDLK